MNQKSLIAILPIMLALTLTGCDSKSTVEPAPPAPLAVVETPQPIPTVETEPLPEVAATTPTDAELTDVVKSYNQEVNASNDKAKEVLENYTGQIESVTGK